jgi:hypothetical protein
VHWWVLVHLGHETRLMHPFSSRAFQKEQEYYLKHPSSVDIIITNKTKQNKQPSFIDRYAKT